MDAAGAKSFLQFLLENISEDFSQLEIAEINDEQGVLFQLSVPENQMGQILGKGGQTAKSLRQLLRVFAACHGTGRISLKISAK